MAWQIDRSHTQATFSIRYLGISFIKGGVEIADAELNFDEEHPENSSLSVRMDMNTFDTHNINRDTHLKSSDLLDVAKHPYIEFATTRIQDKGNGKFSLTGDLTIKGVSNAITFEGDYAGPIKDPFTGQRRVGFTMRTEIDKTDFDVNWNVPYEGGFLLADTVTLDINAQIVED